MGVKRVVVLGAVVVAAVVALRLALPGKEPEPPPQKTPPRVVHVPNVKWGHVDLYGLRLWLPKGFAYDRSAPPDGEIFSHPPVDGFRPNVHLYWIATDMDVRGWYRHHRAKHDGGDSRILDEGSASVAGMPGYFAIYERTVKIKGQPLVTVTKDWYFGKRGGRCGILRCICRGRSFGTWRAIFDTVRSKLEDQLG